MGQLDAPAPAPEVGDRAAGRAQREPHGRALADGARLDRMRGDGVRVGGACARRLVAQTSGHVLAVGGNNWAEAAGAGGARGQAGGRAAGGGARGRRWYVQKCQKCNADVVRWAARTNAA